MKPDVYHLILFLTAVVLGYLYFHKPAVPPTPVFNEKPLKDSLIVLSKLSDSLKSNNQVLTYHNDSLEKTKAKIKVIYKDREILLQSSNLAGLDSVLRTFLR